MRTPVIAAVEKKNLLAFVLALCCTSAAFARPNAEALRVRGGFVTMAWRSSGASNAELVSNLVAAKIIKSAAVEKAMLAVDRGNYAPSQPYEDSPQKIGYAATISAPHMHAYALEWLCPEVTRPGAKVLDVGCGSGYLAACFGRMLVPETPGAAAGAVGEGVPPGRAAEFALCWGGVFGVDYIPGLVALSEANTHRQDGDLLTSGKVRFICGDGWAGLKEEAPFDAIHVGAAASSIPEELAWQLKVGGLMVVPVGQADAVQELVKVERLNPSEASPKGEKALPWTAYHPESGLRGRFAVTTLMSVRYVPLVHAGGGA